MIVVFQASFTSKVGGPARSLKMLIESFNYFKISHKIVVHYSEKFPLFCNVQNINGIKYNSFIGMQFGLKSLSHIFRLIRKENVTFWVNGLWDPICLIIIFSSVVYRKKVIIQPKGAFDDPGLNKYKFLKNIIILILKIFKRNLIFVDASDQEMRNITKVGFTRTYRFTYFLEKKYNLKVPILKLANNLKIIYLSRLDTKKGLLEGLKCLSEFPGELNLVIDIYGDGDKNYINSLKNLSLPKNISLNFLGWIENKPKNLYDNYHFFWLPTKYENFGISVLEALSFGCPVITTINSSWDEIITAECGLIKSSDESWSQTFNRAYLMYFSMGSRLRLNALNLASKSTKKSNQTNLHEILNNVNINKYF